MSPLRSTRKRSVQTGHLPVVEPSDSSCSVWRIGAPPPPIDFYQPTGELSRARQALTRALDAMRRVDLSDDERESLKEDADLARLVLEWIGSYLESGDHSFDKELDALLREEA